MSFAVNQEKCIDNIFKKLEETRRSLTPSATRPGIMHGLCKIYKDIINNCLPFQSILSAVDTPTYKSAKCLVHILKSLTSNEYTVKHSFAFAVQILEQDSDFFMGSLDVGSFLLASHLKRLLASALMHFLKMLKE